MIVQLSSLTPGYENIPAMVYDRRSDTRTRTIYRVARVRSRNDEGLAQVRNISDGGMRLTVGIAVTAGDTLEVSLSDSLVFKGQVIWAEDGECGVEFVEWVDSVEALRIAAEEARVGKARPPRLAFSQPAVVMSEQGLRVIHVYDISQRGMKIGHDGSFTPGLAVKVIVGPGIERRGIVRWVTDDMAGLILTEPFSVQELGSTSAL